VPLYAAAVAAKNAAYASRLFQPNRLAWPVISVGNLSTGGAGKTPFVLALNKLLAEGGWLSDVLTRGHGRQSSEVALVDPAGDPARFSDEPLLLARNGLRVYVARDRIHAGCLAERESAALPRIHILDDGLQHRSLARDIEIILLLAADLRDHLLPAGNLREPLSALRRADVIVLREEDAALAASLRAHLSPPPCIWIVRRALQFRSLDEATAAAPANALAFCAIARFVSLSRSGCTSAATLTFADHHLYTDADCHSLAARAVAARASVFVCTAKDAVKLTPPLLAILTAAAPVIIADLITTFADSTAVADDLTHLLALVTPQHPCTPAAK